MRKMIAGGKRNRTKSSISSTLAIWMALVSASMQWFPAELAHIHLYSSVPNVAHVHLKYFTRQSNFSYDIRRWCARLALMFGARHHWVGLPSTKSWFNHLTQNEYYARSPGQNITTKPYTYNGSNWRNMHKNVMIHMAHPHEVNRPCHCLQNKNTSHTVAS